MHLLSQSNVLSLFLLTGFFILSSAEQTRDTRPNLGQQKDGEAKPGEVVDFPAAIGRTGNSMAAMTSYYQLFWEKGVPSGCDPDGLAKIDLECYDATVALIDATPAVVCFSLTDDTLRCTAPPSVRGSVLVSCTGTRVPESHSLSIRMPKIDPAGACTACGQIYSNTALIYRRCRTDDSDSNTELFPTFFCSGLQDADECFTFGLSTIIDFTCLAFSAEGLSAIAATETDRCIYDAAVEGLTHTEQSLDDRLAPLTNSLIADRGGTNANATYRLYYEYRQDAGATNCEYPMGDVYFVCANGRLPVLSSWTDVCEVVNLASGVSFRRCFEADFGSGRIDAVCEGSSAQEVELLAFQPGTVLPACQDPSQIEALLWVAELCEEDQLITGDQSSVSCSSSEPVITDFGTLWNCGARCETAGCDGLLPNMVSKRATACLMLTESESCTGLFGLPAFLSPFCWIKAFIDFVVGIFT